MARPARDVPWLDTRDGIYYVFWYDAEDQQTHRFSLRTRDPGEATQAYITFLADGKNIVRPRDADITVAQALDDYEREHVNETATDEKGETVQKVADKQRQRQAIVIMKEFFGAGTLLRSIDDKSLLDDKKSRKTLEDFPKTVKGYRDARLAGMIGGGKRRKAAPATLSTIRRDLVVLVSAANHAAAQKPPRIKADDMPAIDLPPDARSKKPEWYREGELKLAIDKASGNLKRYLRILYYTAARRRAIEKLRIVQVEFDVRQIDLHPPGAPRTKKRNPIVPLFDEIEPDLQALVAEARAAGRDTLFGRDMYRDYSRHFGAIGLDHKSNPHIMRHTRATHMLRAGVPTWKVAKLLGDTEATVVRVYGHAIPQDLAEYGREAGMTQDDAEGIAWFNGLSDKDRLKWLNLANSPRPIDAWTKFKESRRSAVVSLEDFNAPFKANPGGDV